MIMKTILNYSLAYIFIRLSVCIGLFFFFFCSCTPHKGNPLLLRADSLMNECPDSVLTILENMPFPQKLSRADRALYALLLTQARHKNYVILDNDSLIKVAVDYYGDTKKSLRAAQSYFYWGATYRDMGNLSFAVEQYMKAIQLAPSEDEFMAMIYDNLADCYLEEDLYDVAMSSYKKAYQISYKDKKQIYYPLRGMARLFLLQNQLDSALCYLQKSSDYALAAQDSSMLPVLYNDYATVYLEKKEFVLANEYISKSIVMSYSDHLSTTQLLKGRVMLNLNQLDSARYYFNMCKDNLDIYEKAVRNDGLLQIERKAGDWEAAVRNADAYLILYDSIQGLSQRFELDKLMNNYQLEEHKRVLSKQKSVMIGSLVTVFLLLILIGSFWLLWNDRKRKKYYIDLQRQLLQKRVDVMLLTEKEMPEIEEVNTSKLAELQEQQLQLCISMFKTTDCYKKLQAMEKATPKQLMSMHGWRTSINATIRNTFIDVMANLKECCPALTNEDLFYCVLSLSHCSNSVIMELLDVSPDALKMRKSRIKSKMEIGLFESVFFSDNQ